MLTDRCVPFGAHRPCAGDRESGLDNRVQERLPAGADRAGIPFRFRLLEGVVDGDREPRMRLLSEALHGQGHPVEKECLGFLLASVAIGVATNSSAFGTASVAKRSGKTDLSERRSQT